MKIDVRVENKNIQLIPFGDIHYGDKSCNWDKVQRMIDWIKSQDNARVILMGDILNSATKSSVGAALFDESSHGQDQLDFVIDALRPIRKKIYGALVGNHPYHKNTEVLTSNGWKKFPEITMNDELAQFNQDTIEVSFSKPIGLNKVFTNEVMVFENNFTKQVVNPEHNLFYDKKLIKAKNLFNNKIDKTKFEYFGQIKQNKIINLTDNDLRFITWTVMDGCMVFRDGKPHHIQFKLSKQRKINELEELMKKANIKYTKQLSKKSGVNILQPYILRIYVDSKRYFSLLNNIKEFPDWFINLTKEQLKVVLETISVTDGGKIQNRISWTSISTQNTNIITAACVINGICCNVIEQGYKSGFKSQKLQYLVNFYLDESLFNPKKFQNIKTSKLKYNDYCYCATMPEGTLITRFEGKVAFSGNCQRITNVTGYDPMKLLAKELGCKYYGYGQFIRIKSNSVSYNIYATHGASGATLPYTKIKSCLALATHIDADIYLMGHVHDLQLHTQEIDRIKYNQVYLDKRYFILTGHYLNYSGSYAEMKNLTPSKQGSPVIDLDMKEKRVRVKI